MRVIIRRSLWVMLAAIFGFVGIDYVTYHSRDRRAVAVVSDLGGRIGSLGGWPLGKEYRIVFTRPLSDAELQRLSVLNTLPGRALVGRNYVAVALNCDLDQSELEAARRHLSECLVFQPDPEFRER